MNNVDVAVFKALSDPTRFKIAVLLHLKGERCVCELAEALKEPDFKISRHVGIMRSAGLVQARRKGTWIYYSASRPKTRLEKYLQGYFKGYRMEQKTIKEMLGRLRKDHCS